MATTPIASSDLPGSGLPVLVSSVAQSSTAGRDRQEKLSSVLNEGAMNGRSIERCHAGVAVDSVVLTVSDAAAVGAFYESALDFQVIHERGDHTSSPCRSMTLGLGSEVIVLNEHRRPGRPVPADSCSHDLWFQHLAIVVSDIRAACDRLNTHGIRHTSPAPQRLPAWNPNAGGIQASYFRDPDGHPLEVISFPPGKGDARWQSTERLFLGIDHTAITVSSTESALRFYRDGLGLDVGGTSENWGLEQEQLSGVPGARVRITSMRGIDGPGVEFLHYLVPANGRAYPVDARPQDLWHVETRLLSTDLQTTLDRLRSAGIEGSVDDTSGVFLRDPDGHALRILPTPSTGEPAEAPNRSACAGSASCPGGRRRAPVERKLT
jgi:catechol 2,3-dioxygenase-like lactoylglutathione lyase family enzyme